MNASSTKNESAGFIGLGHIGGPIALRLVQSGVRVTGFDTNSQALHAFAKQGGTNAATCVELADAMETVFLCLPTPQIVEKVALGSDGLAGGSRVKRIVDFSTIGPRAATHVAHELKKHGISYVECPVTGGVSRAVSGKLTLLAAGPDEEIDMVSPMLASLGSLYRLGKTPGGAQMMKLVNNALSATAFALSSEALVAGTRYGLDLATMVDVLNHGSGRNSATEDKFPQEILSGRYGVGFTFELVQKDLQLFLEEAEHLGTDPQIVRAALAAWQAAGEAMGQQEDCSNIFRAIAAKGAHVV